MRDGCSVMRAAWSAMHVPCVFNTLSQCQNDNSRGMQSLDVPFALDLGERVICHQCGRLSYPHSQCRCQNCGVVHKHVPGCRPTACDQCGLTVAPHRECLCRHCGQRHSKLRGCRTTSASQFNRLPPNIQQNMLDARTDCAQCGSFMYPHSHCRCRSCGRIHSRLGLSVSTSRRRRCGCTCT